MIKMIKFVIVLSMSLFMTPIAAQAAIHTYSTNNGDILTLNTDTRSGTLVGNTINATFSSDALGTFTGGVSPNVSLDLSNVTGTRTQGGMVYAPNANHVQRLVFSNGSYNFWSYWGPQSDPSSANLLGDYVVGGLSYAVGTGSSSSGGGTPVPEPSDFALFGLGALGLMLARRATSRRPASA